MLEWLPVPARPGFINFAAVRYYPKETVEQFELPFLLERVEAYCRTEASRDWVGKVRPSSDLEQIHRWLDQTMELVSVKSNGLYFPDVYVPPVAKELQLLGVPNSVLDGKQFNVLRLLAETGESVIRFLRDKQELYPALHHIVAELLEANLVIKEIDAIVEANGLVKSSASRELAAIRKEMGMLTTQARKTFDQALGKYRKLGWLQDFDESFYNERRVLAVMAEHKRQVNGTIHGMSENGTTVYIEPASMVPINNSLFEMREEERKEVIRILKALTDLIRPYKPILQSYEQALAFLDFTHAKATLAIDLQAVKPMLSAERQVRLINAYHPVLLLQRKGNRKEVVPQQIALDTRQRVLIISGPNAGGKSISLKTVGLLQLMVQCGLPVPVEEHSRMTVFKKLFVDMGDDQSIAFALSTYSSRLLKMKHFLMHSGKDTLFFIDEFGTGSDPELGGALAETMLEELISTKAFGIVTTHYANIKIMAEKHPALINGSMLFDEHTLEPKYVLQMGKPGSSYTFEVATKIGLPKSIIRDAKQKIDGRKVKLDSLLVTLQAKENELNRQKEELKRQQEVLRFETDLAKGELARYQTKSRELEYEATKALVEKGKLYDSLLAFWQKTRDKDALLKKIVTSSEKEETRVLKQKESKKKQQKAQQREQAKSEPPKPLAVGDIVHLVKSKQLGVVQEINKDKATVVFGMMKTIVAVKDLRHGK